MTSSMVMGSVGGQVETYPLACTFPILYGIVMQELEYCQVLELS
jgi:hypothetical protein